MRVRYNSTEKNQLSCQFNEPSDGKIASCVSLSSQQIKLTVGEGATITLYFQFDVFNAISNPPSTTFTDSVILETYKSSDKKMDF